MAAMIRFALAMFAMTLMLAGVVGWESFGGVPAPASPTPFRPMPAVPCNPSEAREALRDRARAEAQAQAATALARPLFRSARRPSAAAIAGAGPTEPALPRLAGVTVSKTKRQALFAPAGSGGKAVVAGEGGYVGAFVVSAIAAGEVTVLGPDGGTRVLRPKFDPAARAAAPVAAAAPVQATFPQAALPSVLDLLRSIPGEGAKPGPPGDVWHKAAR